MSSVVRGLKNKASCACFEPCKVLERACLRRMGVAVRSTAVQAEVTFCSVCSSSSRGLRILFKSIDNQNHVSEYCTIFRRLVYILKLYSTLQIILVCRNTSI